MSTWFSSFSLPNPFKSDDDNDDDDENDHQDNPSTPISASSPTVGLKNDLSALSQTFSNHLRGVAAFLAPPPPPSSSSELTDQVPTAPTFAHPESASSEAITGIKNDLVEIGGSFKSLLSSSSNKAVTGISKLASNFLQPRDDDAIDEKDDYRDLEHIPGIDDQVLDFAREVSLRPELWTDFPLSLPNDFNMSEAQKEHALAVEQLVPSIATLRDKMCSHLSNGQFWMIYFILLLPRLDEADMELLSSSEIIQVRETLLQSLQKKRDADAGTSESETPSTSEVDLKVNITQGDSSSLQNDVSSDAVTTGGEIREVETGKSAESSENEEAGPDESSDSRKHSDNIEDVSFSDLEDEDNDLSGRLSAQRLAQSARVSSASESNEWVGVQGVHAKAGSSTVRGKDSEGEESSDWLTVDDTDLDSLGAV